MDDTRAFGAVELPMGEGIVVLQASPAGTRLGAPVALPAEVHPARRYLKSLKRDTSRPTMEHALNRIARLFGFPNLDVCPWHLMRFTHVDWVRSQLVEGFVCPADPTATPASSAATRVRRRGRPRNDKDAAPPDDTMALGEFVKLAPASGRKHLSALRGVLQYAWQLGYMTHEEYARAVHVKPIPGESAPASAGRAISAGELLAMISTAAKDPEPDGARDVAIFSLGYGLGLRRGDLI